MKKTIICLTLLLFFATTYSQHCPFDMKAIITLHIHPDGSTETVRGLSVTLVDTATGKTAGRFYINPAGSSTRRPIDNEHPAEYADIRFPFAGNNYILVLGNRFNLNACLISIEDIDGNKNGGHFSPVTFFPGKKDLYSLCGAYDEEVYPTYMEEDGLHKWKPVEIVLMEKSEPK